MEIKLGVSIPIERNGEYVGEVRFDPDDVTFAERIYDLLESLRHAEKNYEARSAALEADKEEDENGIPKNARERLKFLREVCEDLNRKIDDVFGEGTSAMVFGGALSLDAITQFMEGVTPYMEKSRASKVDKYLNRDQKRALKK